MDPFARNMLRSTLAFAIALLIIFAAMSITYLHLRPLCPDHVLVQTESVANQWTATVLQRRCQDDSAFVTQVNLRRSTDALRRGFLSGQVSRNNVFKVEQDAAGAGLNLNWTAPDELTIRCPYCDPAFVRQRQMQWGSVRIVYEAPAPK
jgi:hypothetical protein